MVKLKLIEWDKHAAVYSWQGLHVVGIAYDSDTFKWKFPELKINKIISLKIDSSYVLSNYFISRHGETLQNHFEGECKKELEQELEKELKEPLNQRVLLMMLFENIVIVGEK